ncbi:MAG TPA: trehalase family glycosidase, partial [Fimbriimonas sp.]
NLRRATPEDGFPSDYIDTAFNDCVFMWDSVFILQFGRYGSRAFPFQQTLDVLYSKQHPDGFICREVRFDGSDQWHRHDPNSTGPNVLAWSEWNYWTTFRDEERLRRVYPVLAAYHRWMRTWRSWPDGSYWSTGYGCGMDNQPRLPKGRHVEFDHGHMVWHDATMQAALSAQLLAKIASTLGEDPGEWAGEASFLSAFCQENLWDEAAGTFKDRYRDGAFSPAKTVGAFWSMLALDLAPERIERLVAHLEDEGEFNRFHRVPSLSADNPHYNAQGNYWCGGVWAPTNYVILNGLVRIGRPDLAYAIARNHHQRVVEVFESTGTVWENYAPENNDPAQPARKDFVGWGGVPPVAVLLEYVFGLRPDPEERKLVWDIRLTDAFGVERYPFLRDGLLDLDCKARDSEEEEPQVTIRSNMPVTVEVLWKGGSKTIAATP